MSNTQKETVEYDSEFLAAWNRFCDEKGYIKRQAAHACRIAFMKYLTPEQRTELMQKTRLFVQRTQAEKEPPEAG